jgi:predicted RND superfamily exporter protein
VWIDSSFLSKFDQNSDIVLTDTYINQKFGGTSTLNVIFDSDNPDSFKDPAIMRVLDELQTDVDDSLQIVGNSFSLTDYLKRMNMVMNADDPSFNVIPDSRELIAQYLLLYEMSGDPDNLWKVVDYNFEKANMTFQLKSDNSKALNSAIAIIEEHIPALDELGVSVNYAGSGYTGLVFSDLILEGQISSILISLILVIALLSLMFRSLLAGLIGSIPILITSCISFGVMGLLNIPLSTTTALLTSIAIGIGIDYAVHFIERYKIYALETKDQALTFNNTMNHSGQAIFYNAIVVIAGFLVLLFSVFPVNRALGALVSLNMFTSFAGTLTIMPILLIHSNLYFGKKTENKGKNYDTEK